MLNDIHRSVYSWVSLDGDVQDNVRLVKKAAKDDKMFGRFFISVPDFEIHNFSIEELAEVFWTMALENDPDLGWEHKEQLFQKTLGAKTANEFFDLAKRV